VYRGRVSVKRVPCFSTSSTVTWLPPCACTISCTIDKPNWRLPAWPCITARTSGRMHRPGCRFLYAAPGAGHTEEREAQTATATPEGGRLYTLLCGCIQRVYVSLPHYALSKRPSLLQRPRLHRRRSVGEDISAAS
jgi:hypothetical protein